MAVSFVGRESELSAIAEVMVQAIARDRPAAVLIHGPPGIGKTCLLDQVARSAPTDQRLSMTGYRLEQSVPLAAARDLIAEVGRRSNQNTLRQLVFDPGRGDQPVDTLRLFEACHRAMPQCPIVLTVDDLHWLDETSMALCHYLMRAARSSARAFSLVMAARPTSSSSEFVVAVKEVVGLDFFVELELGPLSRDDGRRLARELSPALDSSGADAMWRRSGGWPFWIGILANSGEGDAGVAQLVTSRLRGSSPDTVQVLTTLALAAGPLPPDELAAAQKWPDDRVQEAVQGLRRSGLATDTVEGLRIAHDLIREFIEQSTPSAAAHRTHLLLAEWLEGSGQRDLWSLLTALEHRRAAGLPVATQALKVARSAGRRLLGTDGLATLVATVDLARSVHSVSGPATDGERIVDLQTAVAELATELNAHDVAFERWSRLAEELHEPAERARAALQASAAATELRRVAEARFLLDQARRELRDSEVQGDDPVFVRLDAQESQVLRWLEHKQEEADALTERALDSARVAAQRSDRKSIAPELRIEYVFGLRAGADAALVADDPSRLFAIAEEMTELARGFDDVEHLRARIWSGYALRMLARTADAEIRLRPVWEEARQRVLPDVTLSAGTYLAAVLASQGKLAETDAVCAECQDLADRIGDRSVTIFWIVQQEARLSSGEWRVAIDALREAAALVTDIHKRLLVDETIAIALARLDPVRSAAEVMRRLASARADVEAVECSRCQSEVDLRGTEALARIGQPDAAKGLLSAWEQTHAVPAARVAWQADRARASLAAASGDQQGAIDLLEQVRDNAAAFGFAVEALWAGLDLAAAVASCSRERAVHELRTVAEGAALCQARTELGLAERALRGLGVRTWTRPPAGVAVGSHQLTGREQEIARLAAAGQSNPEIAAELFLSRKTVERHLSNILGKLGLRNRTELAGLIRSEGSDSTGDG